MLVFIIYLIFFCIIGIYLIRILDGEPSSLKAGTKYRIIKHADDLFSIKFAVKLFGLISIWVTLSKDSVILRFCNETTAEDYLLKLFKSNSIVKEGIL